MKKYDVIKPVDVMPGDVMTFVNKVGMQTTEDVIMVKFPYVISKKGYGSILDKAKLKDFKITRSI